MLVYLLVACDGLDEKQEKKLKRAIPDVQTALQAFVAENASATLIEDCESDALADWQLGISQPISKKADLKPLVTLFNVPRNTVLIARRAQSKVVSETLSAISANMKGRGMRF